MRVVAYFAAGLLLAAAIVVIGLRIVANSHRLDPGVVVIEPPVQTPLPRDAGPRNNGRSRAKRSEPRKVGSVPGQAKSQARTLAKPQNRRVRPQPRKTPRTKPKRRPSPQRPVYTPQPGNPQPPPRDPPVTVTAPLPVGVCVRDIARLNHC